jgi:Fe-S-cluster containining protein
MTDLERELTTLCTTCGVCCNGVMFAYVEVAPDELRPETRRRLQVLDGEKRFTLPCRGHAPEGCQVYEDRPQICRGYTCLLYEEHKASPVELDRKLRRVARVKELVASIRARRKASHHEWLPQAIAEMLSVGKPSDVEPELLLDIAELAMRLQRDMGWSPEPEEPKAEEPKAEGPKAAPTEPR